MTSASISLKSPVFKFYFAIAIYSIYLLDRMSKRNFADSKRKLSMKYWTESRDYYRIRASAVALADCLVIKPPTPEMSPLEVLKNCYYEVTWQTVHRIVLPCIDKYSSYNNSMDSYRFQVDKSIEGKYNIPFRPGPIQEYFLSKNKTADPPTEIAAMPCYYLMLGIGKNWWVEKSFKELYPRCQLFGFEADPRMLGDGKFSQFGTAIKMGVQLTSGSIRTIREVGPQRKHVLTKTFPTEGLLDLLDKHVNRSRFIHFVSMDLDGFEVELMTPGLTRGGLLDASGLVICQIDLEVHYPLKKNFTEFWKRILDETPYVPLHVEKFFVQQKISLIHFEDPRCEHLFAFRRVLGLAQKQAELKQTDAMQQQEPVVKQPPDNDQQPSEAQQPTFKRPPYMKQPPLMQQPAVEDLQQRKSMQQPILQTQATAVQQPAVMQQPAASVMQPPILPTQPTSVQQPAVIQEPVAIKEPQQPTIQKPAPIQYQ